MSDSTHDQIAKQIAQRIGGEYNPGEGADIIISRVAIEVEVDANGLAAGKRQLQGYQQLRYLAVPDRLVEEALKATKGTKIGVRDSKGNIRKSAGRIRRRH